MPPTRFFARTAVVALVAVSAAFFAGCGKENGDADDSDGKKSEKKESGKADSASVKEDFKAITAEGKEGKISGDEASMRLRSLDAEKMLKLAEDGDAEAQAMYAVICIENGKMDEAQTWMDKAKENGFEGF